MIDWYFFTFIGLELINELMFYLDKAARLTIVHDCHYFVKSDIKTNSETVTLSSFIGFTWNSIISKIL